MPQGDFNSLGEYVSKLFTSMTHTPTRIEVLPQNYQNSALTPEQCTALFNVRAVADKHYVRFFADRMYLASTLNWGTTVTPAVYSSTALHFGDRDVELSNIAGPKLLGKFQPLNQNKSLQIDTPMTGLFPFRGGLVRLTSGLASLPTSNLLKSFLDTVSGFASKLAQPQISATIDLAESVAVGIQNLMGAGDAKLVLYHDVNYTGTSGQQQIRSGFTFLSDAPSDSIKPAQLWVIDGEAKIGASAATAKRIEGQNYMLIQTEVLETRDDLSQFTSIEQPLQKANDARLMGNKDETDRFVITAKMAVYDSPDLTKPDRIRLIDAISNEFDATAKTKKMSFGAFDTPTISLDAIMARAISVEDADKRELPSLAELIG